jgi:hypothetical protein
MPKAWLRKTKSLAKKKLDEMAASHGFDLEST